jgi:hypothetical protein
MVIILRMVRLENLKGRHNFEDLCMDRRIILEWKQGEKF